MAKLSFESALHKLEQVVQELESGELPLEKSLKKFEEGMQMVQYCSRKLDQTEERIHALLESADGPREHPPADRDHDLES